MRKINRFYQWNLSIIPGNPVISNFERVSKPGRRIFSSASGLPKINNGLGIAIISTPKGVMTDIDARKQQVGGEIICKGILIMSKIGKINITIPEKVKVVLAGNNLNIEGPLGKSSIGIDLDIFNLDIKEGKEISIKPKKIDQNTKRLWGMNRSLINNAVIGSSKGYEKTLELVGVGYRAALKGKQLNLQLGYSMI